VLTVESVLPGILRPQTRFSSGPGPIQPPLCPTPSFLCADGFTVWGVFFFFPGNTKPFEPYIKRIGRLRIKKFLTLRVVFIPFHPHRLAPVGSYSDQIAPLLSVWAFLCESRAADVPFFGKPFFFDRIPPPPYKPILFLGQPSLCTGTFF